MNKNIYAARVFSRELLVLGIFFYIIVISLAFYNIFLALCLFLLFTVLIYFVIYSLGKTRISEIDIIKRTINSIRNNEVQSPDEITLGKYLSGLENDIKAMFFRTQNDISNLKKLEKVRTQFLANVSHELRTPIFAIQGYIETLLDGAIHDPRVNNGFLEKALNKSKNLNDLLNDLIDISMIESGEMRLNLAPIDFFEFVEPIINEYKPLAEEKKLELILKKFDPSLKIMGDRKRLKQVFSNLIQNAIKYTEKGVIEVGVIEHQEDCLFTIRDTGIGLAEKDIDRVFERFYRVDKDRSRTVGGTGLGLAIVKHIVEAHNSKIYVFSELGKGSEFSFRLKK